MGRPVSEQTRAKISLAQLGVVNLGNTHAVRHGMRSTSTYSSWANILQRCTNQNSQAYERYGGRGITVCDRWRNSFENFYADMGERPEGTSIDRINNDSNYEPGNCRWATSTEQNNNRRERRKTQGVW